MMGRLKGLDEVDDQKPSVSERAICFQNAACVFHRIM
jgi:hypothetical protein